MLLIMGKSDMWFKKFVNWLNSEEEKSYSNLDITADEYLMIDQDLIKNQFHKVEAQTKSKNLEELDHSA